MKVRYRSKFEENIVNEIKKKKIKYKYEEYEIDYTQPTIDRTYLPDLYFPKTNIFVELKGRLTIEDRKKHLWIQDQTDFDIRFCFMNANNKIRKGSKTKYSDWCEANNFIWCDKNIPLDWMKQ